MDYTAVIKQARTLQKKREAYYFDRRCQDTLGFLKAKGLLWTKDIAPRGSAKLAIKDVLWTADNVEPRVIEVLPAAILHFPRSFLRLEHLPQELVDIIEALKAGATTGPHYREIPFAKFKYWTEFKIPDGRVRTLSEKKVACSFRLLPAAAHALEEMAKVRGVSQSSLLSEIILQSPLCAK